MIRRPFGPTGIDVPVLGQGTWRLRDEKRAAEALEEGIRLGMTHLDTAELYTGAEQVIRPVIDGRRDDVFLVSKVLPRHASREGVHKACRASLERLGADHLDVYLLHWWSDDHPIEETMQALGELVDEGKTRFVGVSNFDVEELEAAKAALGRHRIACNQVLYHLGARGMESEVLAWCKRERIAVVGYSPFGHGDFPSPRSQGGRVLQEVGDRHGKTPRQVALAFLARDPDVFLIPKAESVEHVRENAGGAFELPKEDADRIDRAFPVKGGLSFL
jgi:diketogulonate reductase-like aldo/keto reductase